MLHKKPVHPKGDPTSNENYSGTICQNHFGVSRITIVDYSLINFHVNQTNRFRVIAVRSRVTFWVDWFFAQHPLKIGTTFAVLNCVGTFPV